MRLVRERATYERNREHLVAIAEGRHVLIVDDVVVGLYDSREHAVEIGWAKFGHRPILTQQVLRHERNFSLDSGFVD